MALRFSSLRLSFEEKMQCQGFEEWEKQRESYLQRTKFSRLHCQLQRQSWRCAKLTLPRGRAFNEAVPDRWLKAVQLNQGPWWEHWTCSFLADGGYPATWKLGGWGSSFWLATKSQRLAPSYNGDNILYATILYYFGIKWGKNCRKAQQMAKDYGVSVP